MTRRRCLWLAVLALLILRGATWFEAGVEGDRGASSPHARLVRARTRARTRLAGCAQEVRDERRGDVARACEQLARHPRTPPDQAGRLLLEAARRWQAAGDQRAQLLCQELVEGPAGDERDRARVELAHQARRVGDLTRALVQYEDIAADVHVGVERRDNASWWCARTCQLLGQALAAERAWRRLAQGARDARLRVRAWDQLGLSYVARGEVSRARAALAACMRELGPLTAGLSAQGVAVRASIDAMKLRRALIEVTTQDRDQEFFRTTMD